MTKFWEQNVNSEQKKAIRQEKKAIRRAKAKLLRKEVWRHRALYLFLLPGLFALLLFEYGPMYGLVTAFQEVKFGRPYGMNDWVGFDNFKRLFNSPWFETILKNTISVSFLSTLFAWPVPLALALLLHNSTSPRLKKISQMATYLPYLLSTVVVVSIINIFFAGDYGLINILLKNMGMEKISFFGEPEWVYPLFVGSSVWKNAGFNAVIYMGALSSVDEQQMEAARIDGATKLQSMWHIQLPTILPTVVTMFILNIGSIFSVGAEKMLLLQTDLNLSASEIISTYVYKVGIMQTQYGFSAAVGMFQNVVNITLLLIMNWICKKKTGTSII